MSRTLYRRLRALEVAGRQPLVFALVSAICKDIGQPVPPMNDVTGAWQALAAILPS